MKQIPYDKLDVGKTYYIQHSYAPTCASGKVMGTFESIIDYKGVPFAQFTMLRSIPGARLPSYMGTLEINMYSTLCTYFYLPMANIIEKRSLLRQLLPIHDESTLYNIACELF